MGKPCHGRACCAVISVARRVGGTEFSVTYMNTAARERCMPADDAWIGTVVVGTYLPSCARSGELLLSLLCLPF